MKKYLETQIKQRREQLIKMDRERDKIAAEKRAYEDALQHLIADDPSGPHDANVGVSPAGGFAMSEEWRSIMKHLWDQGRSFGAADMVQAGQGLGFDTKTPNVRSQLSFYLKRGYIKRVRRGLYSITVKGQEIFNKEAPADSLADASKVTGDAPASPIATEHVP